MTEAAAKIRRKTYRARQPVQVGDRFCRLVVMSEAGWQSLPSGRRNRLVRVRCDCGSEKIMLPGPYSPDNCHWSTAREQSNNTSRNRIIEHDGRSQTLAKWAREIGIKPSTVHQRIKSGWPIAEALTKPLRGKG